MSSPPPAELCGAAALVAKGMATAPTPLAAIASQRPVIRLLKVNPPWFDTRRPFPHEAVTTTLSSVTDPSTADEKFGRNVPKRLDRSCSLPIRRSCAGVRAGPPPSGWQAKGG